MSSRESELLSLLRNVIFVIAIYAYFMGWIYAHYLFNQFGIGLNSVDIPIYYFFVYSYSVLASWATAIILFVAIPLLYIFTAVYLKPVIPALVLVVLFPIFFCLSRDKAINDARDMRLGHAKTIILTLERNKLQLYPESFLNANKRGELKLITETESRFYVLHQPIGEKIELPYGHTYNVTKSDVLLATVEIPNISAGKE